MKKIDLAEYKQNAMIQTESLYLDNFTAADLKEVLENIHIMKKALKIKELRELARQKHPFSIGHSEKSGWYTDVKDDEESKRRKVRKSTEDQLLDYLVEFYHLSLEPEVQITIRYLYELWFKRKETPNNQETMRRYSYIWKAYYDNEPISHEVINKPLKDITKKELRDWAEDLIRKHEPDRKKFNNIFSIISQLYIFADEEELEDIGDTAIWDKAKHMINKKLLREDEIIEPETQVFTDEEILWIQEEVRKDLKRYEKQSSSAGLQILFLIETALRIGEACGLKWSDIDYDKKILYIRRQANNERVKQPKTKTSIRKIPLTVEAIKILDEVKAFNAEHNYDKEWIFQSDNADYEYRLSYNAADRKLRKLCNRMHAEERSPHKIRKTTLSLLCDSINIKTAQKFAGHKDCTTTQKYYYFDRSSEEEQAVKINQAICFDKKKDRKEELTKLVSDILENSSDMNSSQLAEYIINALNLAS